jgi:hypothetical protein
MHSAATPSPTPTATPSLSRVPSAVHSPCTHSQARLSPVHFARTVPERSGKKKRREVEEGEKRERWEIEERCKRKTARQAYYYAPTTFHLLLPGTFRSTSPSLSPSCLPRYIPVHYSRVCCGFPAFSVSCLSSISLPSSAVCPREPAGVCAAGMVSGIPGNIRPQGVYRQQGRRREI